MPETPGLSTHCTVMLSLCSWSPTSNPDRKPLNEQRKVTVLPVTLWTSFVRKWHLPKAPRGTEQCDKNGDYNVGFSQETLCSDQWGDWAARLWRRYWDVTPDAISPPRMIKESKQPRCIRCGFVSGALKEL